MTGLVGLFLLLYPSVRRSLHSRKKPAKTAAKRQAVWIVVIDKVLALGAVVLIQYAAARGHVSLVFALSGIQCALMFVLVYFLTRFAPKLFKEYFTKRELIVQTMAIGLMVAGSALFANFLW